MQIERELKDKNVTEIVTMRKEIVHLSIMSWVCFIQVDSSSEVNLRLLVNRVEVDQPDTKSSTFKMKTLRRLENFIKKAVLKNSSISLLQPGNVIITYEFHNIEYHILYPLVYIFYPMK